MLTMSDACAILLSAIMECEEAGAPSIWDEAVTAQLGTALCEALMVEATPFTGVPLLTTCTTFLFAGLTGSCGFTVTMLLSGAVTT